MTKSVPSKSTTIVPAASVACPDRHTLAQLVSDTMPADGPLVEHLESCEDCQRLLDQLTDSGLLSDYRPWIRGNWTREITDSLPTLDPPLRPNDLGRLGDLAILSVLARGGMGIVFRGQDLRLGREVAVKFILPGSSPQAKERFAREARAIAALQHESIVPIYHTGQNAQGQDFIVLPLIQGLTLRARLKHSEMEPEESAEYIRQIADALATAHAAGLIHRDVKPDNILLDSIDQRAKITDFGLVRIVQEGTLTMADVLCGTPEYMSPEQASLGDRIDHRSDIYSLGITLYECLTGATPFRGRPLEVIDQHRLTFPVAPSRLNRKTPADLETICLKAICKEMQDRYQTMEAFRDDLQRFLDGKPIVARPVSSFQVFRLWCRRNPRLALALASTVGSLLIGTVVSSFFWMQSSSNARQSQRLASELSVNQQQLQTALVASETQRKQAEKRFAELRKLANELVFDIFPQVEYLENSLAVRQSIISSALQYLDELYQEADDNLQLQAELATAYEKIGEILGMTSNTNLGDKDSGMQRYQRALQLRKAVYDADPTNPESIERLAHNHYIVGRTLWARDEIKEAELAFQTSLDLQRQLVSKQTDSEKALNKLATILIDAAAIPSWDGQYELATQYYDQAQEILDGLIERFPEQAEYRKTITRLLRANSRIYSGQGKVQEGEACLLKAIEIGQVLVDTYPDDFSVTRSVWLSRFMLGELYIKNQVIDKVIPACQAAINFPKSVAEREPANAFVSLDLANAYFNLSRSYRLNADYSASIVQAQNAVQVMQKLVEAFPTDREYQRNLALHLIEIARGQLELGQSQDSVQQSSRAIELLIGLAESESGSLYNLYDLSMARRVAAQAHFRSGNRDQAVVDGEECIRLIKKLSEAGLPQADEKLLDELNDELLVYLQD